MYYRIMTMKLNLIGERKLKQKDRDALPTDDFAIPSKRAYPVNDRSHAANALSRSSGKSVAGKVKKKVCSKYPDMASCDEEIRRYINLAVMYEATGQEATQWKSTFHQEPAFVTQEQADGTKKQIRVMRYRVEITDGHKKLVFRVGKGKDGYPVFTDDREARTGHANVSYRGPLPGERYAKGGPIRTLTPTGWANEVERLIGPMQIGQIFIKLIQAGFNPGKPQD